MSRRRLRRRFGRGHSAGHAPITFLGGVRVAVTLDRGADQYRGDISWPEVSDTGRVSPSIRHHKIVRIATRHVMSRVHSTAAESGPARAIAAHMMLNEAANEGLPEVRELATLGTIHGRAV